MTAASLPDEAFWDEYWRDVALPVEASHETSLLVSEILRVFDRNLPRDPGLSALEIGGAPGQYLAYLHRRFGYGVCALDSSAVGCARTRENFALLDIRGRVVHGKAEDDPLGEERFDVVCSLGLIEHAGSEHALVALIGHHVRLARAGGLVVVGCPNLRGLNGVLLRRLAPDFLALHDRQAMDPRGWAVAEAQFGLQTVWKGYIGGFEPGIAAREERSGRASRTAARALGRLATLLDRERLRPLRRANSRGWSAYVLAVYLVPD